MLKEIEYAFDTLKADAETTKTVAAWRRYADALTARGLDNGDYFPAYRQGEFA